MTGINYMGGSRNAAKGRRKDPTGLAQKAHFSKLRHRIFTRSLCNVDDHPESSGNFLSQIDFEHAKRDLKLKGVLVESTPKERPPDPFPSVKRSTVRDEGVGEYARKKPFQSKLINDANLDDSDEFREKLDRIIATPDILGIAHLRKRKKVTQLRGPTAEDPNISSYEPNVCISDLNTSQEDNRDNPFQYSHSEYVIYSGPVSRRPNETPQTKAPSEVSWPSSDTRSGPRDRDPSPLQELEPRAIPGSFRPSETYTCAEKPNLGDSPASVTNNIPWTAGRDSIGVFPSQADEQSETGHSAEQALISDDYPSSISTPSHPSSRSSGVSLQEPVSLLDVDNPWHFLDQILHLPRVSTRSTGDKSDPFDGLRSYDRSGLGFNPNSSVGDYWAQNYTNEVIDDDDGSSDHGLLLFEDCSSVTSPEDNSGVHAVFSTPPDGHLRDDKDREICAIVDNSVEGVTEKLTAGPTSIFGASFEYYVRHATDRPSDESGSGDEKNGSDIEEFKQIPSCNVVATNQAGHAVQTGELDLHTPPPILSELMFDDDDNEVEFEGPDLFVGLDDIDDDDDE